MTRANMPKANADLPEVARLLEDIAEELAQELLRDQAFRDEMRALIRAAVAQAHIDLLEPRR